MNPLITQQLAGSIHADRQARRLCPHSRHAGGRVGVTNSAGIRTRVARFGRLVVHARRRLASPVELAPAGALDACDGVACEA